MSRGMNEYLSDLNSVDAHNDYIKEDQDLTIFSNTLFFNMDNGMAADMAASADDLLMQQERQVQTGLPNEVSLANMGDDINFSIAKQHDQYSSRSFVPRLERYRHEQHRKQQDYQRRLDVIVDVPPEALSPAPASYQQSPTALPHSIGVMDPQLIRNELQPPQELRVSTHQHSHPHSQLSGDSPSTPGSNSPDSAARKNLSRSTLPDSVKRTRNTLASARFRVKKKLQEQEMQRTSRELKNELATIKARVQQLEMENKLLRNLIIEKNDARGDYELARLKSRILKQS